MISAFIKNSIIYGLGRVGIVLLNFIKIPILTNNLSPAQYGVMDLMVLCVTLLNLSVAMEISQAVARFFQEGKGIKQRQEYTSTALLFSIGMYVLTAIALLVFYQPLGNMLFGSPESGIYILLVIPWFMLNGLNYFISNQLRWENRPKPQVSLQMMVAIFLVLGIYYFVSIRDLGVVGAAFAYIVSFIIPIGIGLFLLMRSRSIGLLFSKPKLKEMLSFSFPLVPSSLAVFAQNYIDRMMITGMLNFEDLGLYSLAFRISALLMLFISVFQMSVTPLIYEHYKKKETPQDLSDSFGLFLLLVCTATVGLNLFLPELFYLFIGSDFYNAASLIPILCFAVVLSNAYVFAPGLSIAKKTKIIALINIGGMVLNTILNYVFIQYMGLYGAAIATVISLFVLMVVNFYISQKYYRIPYQYGRIILGSGVTIGLLYIVGTRQNMIIETLFSYQSLEKIGMMFIILGLYAVIFVKKDMIEKITFKR